MKGLNTLIRIHRRELDELRRHLAVLEGKRDAFLEQYHRLHEELVREIEASKDLTEMRGFFGNFSESIKQRQLRVREEIRKVETKIQTLLVEIQARFSEVKKYEIAQEQFEKREAEAAARKEQIMMDELAIEVFRRKEERL